MRDGETVTREYPDLDALIAACTRAGIGTVVLAWRQEWGPPQIATEAGDYAWRDECRVLAYRAGAIHAHDCVDHDRQALRARLSAAGFAVEERSRNLTRFDAG